MPWVKGYLQVDQISEPPTIWPSPGHPAHPIAPGGPPPEVGIPVFPTNPIFLPDPPPGIFPPPSVANPIVPVPPTVNPQPPPGEIWPPIDGAPSGKFWMVVYIPGLGFKYVLVDPSLKPTPVK
jgi:hypothetical protein